MLNLTRPQYVMPMHGDHKRLYLHAKLAESVGIDPENIFKGQNGMPLEIDGQGARFGEEQQSGMIFVDGVEVGDIEDVALRDRRALSADGVFIVVATVSGPGRPVDRAARSHRRAACRSWRRRTGWWRRSAKRSRRSLAPRPTRCARSRSYRSTFTTTSPLSSTSA